MECKEVKTYLQSYIDGQLDPVAKMRIEFHLSYCDRCSEALDNLIEAKIDSGEIQLVKAPFYPSIIDLSDI